MKGRRKGRFLKFSGLLVLLVVGMILWQFYEPAVFTKHLNIPTIKPQDKIWVITDIHHLSETLVDDGVEFQRIKDSASGKELDYMKERLEALVWQVEKERPNVLLVSGDLTFNGEKDSAIELATYFKRIKELGTAVFVIPGNHDITDGWAHRYVGSTSEPVTQILPSDFSDIFAEMGYEEAFSRDSDSLSYAVQPFADVIFVMLDTNKYDQEESKKAPEISGQLLPKTKRWFREVLATARAEELMVIPVMHHNLIEHNEFVNKGYTIDHASDLQDFFFKNDLSVVLSGHIHAQDIQEMTQGNKKITEIVTGSFASLSSSIGEITIKNKELTYQQQVLALEDWAEVTNQQHSRLLNYTDYVEGLFKIEAINMTEQWMYDENWYDTKTAPIIGDFIGRMNIRYFEGENYDLTGESLSTIKNDEGYQLLKEHPNSFLTRYVESLICEENRDNVNVKVKLK